MIAQTTMVKPVSTLQHPSDNVCHDNAAHAADSRDAARRHWHQADTAGGEHCRHGYAVWLALISPVPSSKAASSTSGSHYTLAAGRSPVSDSAVGRLPSAGIAIAVYGLVGVFGAARYGLATEGDLLVNSWLHGRAEGVLDGVLVAYLAISIPPIQVQRVLLAAKVLRPDTRHDPLE